VSQKKLELSESLEDYLEIILDLETMHKVARPKDIAEKMGVQRGTVTGALKALEKRNLINYEPYSLITLTRTGARIARELARRHAVLKDFLDRVLQIDPETADAIACRMEHAMDKHSFDKFVRFLDFLDNCPRTGPDWIESFVTYCASLERNPDVCRECLDRCMDRHRAVK